MHIDSYSYGKITVDGRVYNKDLIIFPERIRTDWWRKADHSLLVEDLQEIVDYKPELLIVGKGESGFMQVPEQTKDFLEDKKIELIETDTAEAVFIFNEQLKRARKLAGAFHLTC